MYVNLKKFYQWLSFYSQWETRCISAEFWQYEDQFSFLNHRWYESAIFDVR